MIEQALYAHLQAQEALRPFLAEYAGTMAVFNQEAPGDTDAEWSPGPQYGRVIFAVDLQGDAERTMGGLLTVDIMCKPDEKHPENPEDIEPLLRQLIHGWFFSSGTFTVAAQWKNSSYFSEENDDVNGCTLTFDLLAFPVLTTHDPDVIDRLNKWTSETLQDVHVINHDELPAAAWRPDTGGSAVYWRLVNDAPARWIPDTYQTIWRTATVRAHIFACSNAETIDVARRLVGRLYAARRLIKSGESPIMVDRSNSIDLGADPLRTGQVTIESVYGIIVYFKDAGTFDNINF